MYYIFLILSNGRLELESGILLDFYFFITKLDHFDGFSQLAEICKMGEDSAMAAELIGNI